MFDTDDQAPAPPSTEVLGAALVVFCVLLVGVDLYLWVAHHRAPSLAVLYIPTFSLQFLRRVQVADGERVWMPLSWSYGLGAYYVAIVAFAAGRGIRTTSDELLVGLGVFNIAAILFRVYRDRRKLAARSNEAHEARG